MDTAMELTSNYKLMERAIHFIESNVQHQPELAEIAAAVGMSEYHFQRLFTRWTGISPKRFMQFLTKEHAKDLLARSENLLEATHQTGLSSLGRLHDLFISTEAVTPGEYKSGGAGLDIRYGIHPTPFGRCLIAVTERGVCHLSFVQTSEASSIDEFVGAWDHANISEDYRATTSVVARIFSRIEPNAALGGSNQPLRLHLRGTNFQIKVWEALLNIPFGALTTYEHIAEDIGQADAVRAVGTAIGHNPVAYLIPCHRVIRKTGDFGNYRWGAARKKIVLAREYGMTVPERA